MHVFLQENSFMSLYNLVFNNKHQFHINLRFTIYSKSQEMFIISKQKYLAKLFTVTEILYRIHFNEQNIRRKMFVIPGLQKENPYLAIIYFFSYKPAIPSRQGIHCLCLLCGDARCSKKHDHSKNTEHVTELNAYLKEYLLYSKIFFKQLYSKTMATAAVDQ